MTMTTRQRQGRSIKVNEKLYWDLKDLAYKKSRVEDRNVTLSEIIREALDTAVSSRTKKK